VRVGRTAEEGESEGGDVSSRVTAALRSSEDQNRLDGGGLDLNSIGPEGLARWLSGQLGDPPGTVRPEARTAATAICDARDQHHGLLTDMSVVTGLPGVTGEMAAALSGSTFLGEFIIREVDFIGPSAGRELRVKTFWAMGGALAGILIYIWVRFRFVWGLAAVAALVHDVVITLGMISITQKDFSLPVVAGILAIIGYSLNDTIVIFDRIRENLHSARVRDLLTIVNQSINQNLSRTMLTSVTTLFVVLTLFFFGGEKMNSLSFALIVGVLAGTYSSIFIASPFLLIWEKAFGRQI
jgi:preprotein translocase subunit SecF